MQFDIVQIMRTRDRITCMEMEKNSKSETKFSQFCKLQNMKIESSLI